MDSNRAAIDFCKIIHAWLDASEMATVVERNRKEENPCVCHTHDFIDANEAMLQAWAAQGVDVAVDPTDEKLKAWSEAWTLAKSVEFDAAKLGGEF